MAAIAEEREEGGIHNSIHPVPGSIARNNLTAEH
jgi:hypothetical protein